MNSIRTAAYILKSAAISKETREALEKAQERWFKTLDYANTNSWLGSGTINSELSKAAPIIEKALKEHYGGDLTQARKGRFSELAGFGAHTILPMLAGLAATVSADRYSDPTLRNTLGLSGLLGLVGGVGQGLTGGLMGINSDRTVKEQFEQNERPSHWKNLLIPGYAAYNGSARENLYAKILSDPSLATFSEN